MSEVSFYTIVAPLMEELEAARETRREDPERWHEAAQAYDEMQTLFRLLDEAARAYMQGDSGPKEALEAAGIEVDISEAQETVHEFNAIVRADTAKGAGTAKAPGGN